MFESDYEKKFWKTFSGSNLLCPKQDPDIELKGTRDSKV